MGDLIWGLIVAILVIVPLWRICGRAGFSPGLSLLVLIPWLGFLVIALVFAYADWPNRTKAKST